MKLRRSALAALVVVSAGLLLLGGLNWWLHRDRAGDLSRADSAKTEAPVHDKPAPQPTRTPLSLYFVGVSDNGTSGSRIGCDDSLIEVKTASVTTTDKLKDSIKRLLDQHDQTLPGSGLYNALAASQLMFQSSELTQDTVTIRLVGDLKLGGACDLPRVKAQLEHTAMTASDAKQAAIYINGKLIDDMERGT